MKLLASIALVMLLGSASWASERPQLDNQPLILDLAQLDKVAAGDRHDTPFYRIIYTNQRSLLALNLALTRGLAGTVPSATREHVLLARQVGFVGRD